MIGVVTLCQTHAIVLNTGAVIVQPPPILVDFPPPLSCLFLSISYCILSCMHVLIPDILRQSRSMAIAILGLLQRMKPWSPTPQLAPRAARTSFTTPIVNNESLNWQPRPWRQVSVFDLRVSAPLLLAKSSKVSRSRLSKGCVRCLHVGVGPNFPVAASQEAPLCMREWH